MDDLGARAVAPVGFSVAESGESIIVTIAGELDISSVDALANQVAGVLARKPAGLIVDVSGVRFADSSAIALWVRWAASVSEFELRNPSPLLSRVILAMGLAGTLGLTP
jgi:anti-anti-sigma factor